MNDHELLRMAAKAAGISFFVDSRGRVMQMRGGLMPAPWNPLADDGDALRLGSRLLLNVLSSEACIVAEDENGVECIEYMYGPEDYASGWRRAIVRAAASIGEQMK